MTNLNNTPDTNTPDFNDQALDFSSFSLPTAGETASMLGEQVAQKTSKATRKAALILALGAVGTANISCGGGDEPIKPGSEVVDNKKETDKYTPEQWVTINGIKLERKLNEAGGALSSALTVIKGTDGKYYLKPDFKLNKDNIKTLGEKIIQTSGLPAEDLHIYVNVRSMTDGINTGQQGFEADWNTTIHSTGDVLLSKLTPNPSVFGKDLEQNYRPNNQIVITAGVSLKREIMADLTTKGIITPTTQWNYQIGDFFSYNIGK